MNPIEDKLWDGRNEKATATVDDNNTPRIANVLYFEVGDHIGLTDKKDRQGIFRIMQIHSRGRIMIKQVS